MSIPAIVQTQRDFTAGELDPLALRRDDTQIMRAGLKRALNMRPLPVGPVTRRDGWAFRWAEPGARVGTARPVADKRFWIEFSDGTWRARHVDTPGTVHTEIDDCPWGAAEVADLNWTATGIYMIVVNRHGTMRPQVFTYDRASETWVREDFQFRLDRVGEKRQPYWRFAATRGITMNAGARTGSTTISFNEPVLQAGHVGARFRYIGKEVEITAVNSSQSANVTVIDSLPPSQKLRRASAGNNSWVGFAVGELVEGFQSGAFGEISSFDPNGTDALIQIHRSYNGFVNDEIVVGPKTSIRLHPTDGVFAPDTPTLTPNWEEEFMNDLHGWPGHVAADRQRVIFSRFPQFPQAIIWSAVGTIDDFEVGTEADAAIFEFVPGEGAVEMVVGGPDQFVLTDDGIYYVPISGASPLVPGSVEFRLISSDAAAPVKPVWTPQGMLFISATGSRVLALVPTGQTAQPYLVEDVSRFHGHLLNDPVELAATGAGEGAKERQVYVVNGDGSIAMARYDRSQEWVGWFPWRMHGAATGIASHGERLLATFDHGGGVTTAEELSHDHRFDTAIDADDADALALFEGEELEAWGENRYLGLRTIGTGGTVEGDALPDGAYLGFDIEPEIEPFIPNMGEGESVRQRMRRRRIKSVTVRVSDTTGFNIGKRIIASYRGGEDQNEPPPKRSETYRHRMTGRSHEPEVAITQPIPGDLTIVEVSMEVTV